MPEEWAARYAESAHRIVFGELHNPAKDRLSYALLIIKDDEPIAYVTVKENDSENVYWQFGGVFPEHRKSMTAVKCIELGMTWQRQRSKRILTYVENTNYPMLRFYMSYGFIIIGTRHCFGKVMVDLCKEFNTETTA